MTSKEFSVLFDTPDYMQTSDETRRFMGVIKALMKSEFDDHHPNASDIEMYEMNDFTRTLKLFDLVTDWMLKVNAQLDEISERQAEIFAMIAADKKEE